jgi:HEAT repeat protein
MLPTRSTSLRVTPRLTGLALIVLIAGTLAWPTNAAPLPRNVVESFQQALAEVGSLAGDDPSAVAILVRFRKDLREAARQLPYPGDVSRVLLLQEWRVTDFSDVETPATIDKVEAAVRQPTDEAFRRAVQNLLKTESGEGKSTEIAWLVSIAIKREVRLSLLERFENRLGFYLRSGRSADRIAAANLISETMNNARKQVSVEVETRRASVPSEEIVKGKSSGAGKAPPAPKIPSSVGTGFLRERMARLGPSLEKLTQDRDPQVQVAGVRALGDIESPQVSVAVLRTILEKKETSNVLLRRATAETLSHMLDLASKKMDNDRYVSLSEDRFLSPLSTLEQVLPAATIGLTDSDVEVRRHSVEACQKIAATLHELVTDKSVRPRLASFDPMMKAVRRALPVLGNTARYGDRNGANTEESAREADIRRTACHVLETLVLVMQDLDRLKKAKLPEPTPELPDVPEPGKKPDKEGTKGAPLPPNRGNRRSAAGAPSQWAAARLGQPAPTTPGVTLGRPKKLSLEELVRRSTPDDSALRSTAFVAQKIEELQPPNPLDTNLRGTVDAMIAELEDPDYRVRLAAVDVLETAGEAAVPAIPALVKALSDRNKFVRWSAARTLGRLHPRQAKLVVPALTRLLNDREDLSVRITAAYALEKYGPDAKDAVPHLARVLNRGDKEYIIAVLHTVQGIGTDATPALPSVAWILRDRDLPSSVRIEAAQTLGRFGRLAMGQLRDLRQVMETDSDEEVRNAASAAVLAVDRPK